MDDRSVKTRVDHVVSKHVVCLTDMTEGLLVNAGGIALEGILALEKAGPRGVEPVFVEGLGV